MNIKNKSGITLIALIVTIIVLIIIAGISIATLTADNGILRQTNSAKVTQIEATAREQVNLAISAMRLAIAEAQAQDNSYSAKKNSDLIQTKLLEILNIDIQGLNGEFNDGGIAARSDQSEIRIVYEGDDYKNACNNELAKITYQIGLEQKSIELVESLENSDENTIEQVIDANPGVLETSETGAYVINSIEDLVFFAYDVRNGNTYSGQTVELGLSLDFSSEKSYVNPSRTDYATYGYDGVLSTMLTSGEGFEPIGKTSNIDARLNAFAGTFDGKNNQIINMYINKVKPADDEMRLGLFGNNSGTIKNVHIVNGNISHGVTGSTGDIGGISSSNYGTIENCSYTGNITIYTVGTVTGTMRAGGISANSEAGSIVRNCYFDGNIYGEATTETASGRTIGGISSGNAGEISGCYSKGNIVSKNMNNVGGLIGNNRNILSNCYNLANITSYNTGHVGGLIARAQNNSTDEFESIVDSCYNIGNISASNYNYLGTFSGGMYTGNITNSYSKTNSSFETIGMIHAAAGDTIEVFEKTETEMKSTEFINLLNANTAGAYKQDTSNINNGYPILSWQ